MKRLPWFIADLHLHHKNLLAFRDDDGSLIRGAHFSSVEEMNETIIENWNKRVRPGDTVYDLGDVLFGTSIAAFEILKRLNGRHVLIKGNHDRAKLKRYVEHFADVRSEVMVKSSKGVPILCSHRPQILPHDELVFNVHGHLHHHIMRDPRYINVSVEHTNYAPVSWEELMIIIEKRLELIHLAERS